MMHMLLSLRHIPGLFALAATPLAVDFEDGKIPAGFVVKAPKPYSITVQKEIVRNGKYAARFELRKGDVFLSNGIPDGFRAELKDTYRATVGGEDWYSFSVYLPKDFPIHGNRFVFGQWNASPDNAAEEALERSPPLSQRFINGKFRITLYKEPLLKTFPAAGKKVIFETKDFALGRWHDFVYQIKWSHKNGFVNAWRNGEKFLSYEGPIGYDDKEGPYFKFGLYRDDVPETYVAYFDDYRRGKTREELK